MLILYIRAAKMEEETFEHFGQVRTLIMDAYGKRDLLLSALGGGLMPNLSFHRLIRSICPDGQRVSPVDPNAALYRVLLLTGLTGSFQ
jgi:hypothetical protein